MRYLEGEEEFIPFHYQGQYYDKETQLCYNRFRYYSPETGLYISQDPIELAGNNPNFYAYVFDSNAQVDVFGLDCFNFSANIEQKLKTHAADIYKTARELGVNIPKKNKEAMKDFMSSIANDSNNLANSSPIVWNTIKSTNIYVKNNAIVLVDMTKNEILTFLHKERISSYLKKSMDLL